MGVRFIVTCLVVFHAASSKPTLNPSSTTLRSLANSSSASTSTVSQTSAAISFASNPSVSTISQPITASSFSSNPSVTTSSEFGFLSPKPSSSYQVTENVIDIPDNKTLTPIVPNYGLFKPLNVANTSVSINNVNKNDTGDENNKVKKTSFTYVHVTQDIDENKEGGITKLLRGIKNYVYNLKRNVVDGLHSYFRTDGKKKDKEESVNNIFHRSNEHFNYNDEIDFHQEFHKNFDSDENSDDYEYDHDEFKY